MHDKRPETRYEFKLNFKEITLFVVGSIGVISLFFIIGIWIGKSLNAVPNEILKEEYLTERNFPDEDGDYEETELDITKKDDETSYDFQAALKGEGITPLKEEDKIKIAKEKKKSSQKNITSKKTTDKLSVAEKNKEIIDTKTTITKKVDIKKKEKEGGYTIQIASLKSDKAAIKLKNKLQKKGYDAYFVATDLKEKGVWYRVRIGSFSSKTDANKIITKIEKTMKIKGMVVRDLRN